MVTFLYGKCTRALTFENVGQATWEEASEERPAESLRLHVRTFV
jgi:hypothetical protein